MFLVHRPGQEDFGARTSSPSSPRADSRIVLKGVAAQALISWTAIHGPCVPPRSRRRIGRDNMYRDHDTGCRGLRVLRDRVLPMETKPATRRRNLFLTLSQRNTRSECPR